MRVKVRVRVNLISRKSHQSRWNQENLKLLTQIINKHKHLSCKPSHYLCPWKKWRQQFFIVAPAVCFEVVWSDILYSDQPSQVPLPGISAQLFFGWYPLLLCQLKSKTPAHFSCPQFVYLSVAIQNGCQAHVSHLTDKDWLSLGMDGAILWSWMT